MAVERVLFAIKQDIMIKASELAVENAALLREGKLEEATVKMGEIQAEMDRTRTIDALVPDILGKLQAAGIAQPPVEYLQTLVSPSSTTEQVTPPKARFGGVDVEDVSTSTYLGSDEIPPAQPWTEPAPVPTAAVVPVEHSSIPTLPSTVEAGKVDLFEDVPTEGLTPTQLMTLDAIKDLTILEKRAYSKEEIADEIVKKAEGEGKAIKREGFERTITEHVSKVNAYFSKGRHPFKIASFTLVLENRKSGRQPVGHLLARIPTPDAKLLPPAIEDNEGGIIRDGAMLPAQVIEVTDTPPIDNSDDDLYTESQVTPAIRIETPIPVAREVEERLNPQLSGAEMYLLGQQLREKDGEVLSALGIRLPEDDRVAVGEILQRLGSYQDVVEESASAGEALTKKLIAFQRDKQSVFMANMDDEDAQFLLTFLAGVESEDQISQLLDTFSET